MTANWVKGLAVEVAKPLLRRAGTVIAVALMAKGVSQEHANLLLTSMGALLGVSFDIALVLMKRRNTE